jgi:hypothetical protein
MLPRDDSQEFRNGPEWNEKVGTYDLCVHWAERRVDICWHFRCGWSTRMHGVFVEGTHGGISDELIDWMDGIPLKVVAAYTY